MTQHRRIRHVLVAIALGGSFIAGVASWPVTAQTSNESPNARKDAFQKAVLQRTTLEIPKCSLSQAVATLREKTGLDIVLDREALAELNISEQSDVSLSFSNGNVVDGLREQLATYGLTCRFEDEKVVIAPSDMDRALARPIDVTLDHLSLSEAMKQIGKLAGVNIVLDSHSDPVRKALEKTVARRAKQIRVRELLPSLLEPHGLTYLLRDEVVLITDLQEPALVTRVYPIHDMITNVVNWKDEKAADKRAEKLRQFILSAVETKTWTDSKGRGSIEYFAPNQSFVVTQTQTAHERLAQVLLLLRRWNEFNGMEFQVSDVEAIRSKNQTFLR